jgi:hypothetical protein
MELAYKKYNNNNLFSNFENIEFTNLSNIQNYIPIYQNFFTLNESNYNSINLNNKYYIRKITSKESDNKYTGEVSDISNVISKKQMFFKYSPLLDPTKYITGKYDVSHSDLIKLPNFVDNEAHAKLCDPNNSAYVDSFFSYLTSQLLNNNEFTHGIDFYGSFLGVKHNFIYDINDEVDYLYDSDYFHKNKSVLFTLENAFQNELLNKNTRNYKSNITIGDDISNENIVLTDADINIVFDISNLDMKDPLKISDLSDNNAPELCYEGNIAKASQDDNSSVSCSSRSSNSNIDEDEHYSSSEDDSLDSNISDEVINININEFPVQLIALERCEDTFDSLLTSDRLTDDELSSIIIQILMMLVTYQKVFSFTHNDLHTNNIMYIETDKQYLFYKYCDRHYKVPTFGRIFKLIDFGRAIYKFRGNTICSDSYHPEGDAATQYNCEPYFNDNKPRLNPNNSFDLCRLGCSLFDYFVDELENAREDNSDIINIIIDWCHDDKNRNVLYKTNGEERYPDFKLYKMIARTVNKHIPCDVIKNPHFDKYIVPKKKIKKNNIINIDNMVSQS